MSYAFAVTKLLITVIVISFSNLDFDDNLRL